jgi:predicted ferric reductase
MQTELSRDTHGPGFLSRTWRHLLLLGIGAVGAVIGMAIVNPGVLRAIVQSFAGADATGYWNFSRATAFSGYILLWISMLLGLAVTKRIGRVWPGGPALTDLHEYVSLLGIGMSLLHVVSLLGERYITYTWQELFIPFASAVYRPFWVGLGQVGFYLLLIVTFSFYVRRRIGYKTWRSLHFLSFLVFVLALVHGIFSGSDTGAPWVSFLYSFSGATTLLLTLYRIFHARMAASVRAEAAA